MHTHTHTLTFLQNPFKLYLTIKFAVGKKNSCTTMMCIFFRKISKDDTKFKATIGKVSGGVHFLKEADIKRVMNS